MACQAVYQLGGSERVGGSQIHLELLALHPGVSALLVCLLLAHWGFRRAVVVLLSSSSCCCCCVVDLWLCFRAVVVVWSC